ncbi:hypothetical protein B0H11DRAFT_2128638 [Mycena galericulata]|nr:hypothetical protein B0H11DRAFT_2128638 [Mycena galericulata]
MLEVLAHRSFILCLRSFILFFALFTHVVAGQTFINGQTFTNGLAIIDSPSPLKYSPLPAFLDRVFLTRYDSLEIYLVSANFNITVSAGPAFLTGESGSTVKHLNWPIPTCLSPGDYNLTFYEASHFNSQGVFTITPIPIPISNPSLSGNCSNLNPVQSQPQPSNPLPQSPFAPGSSLATTSRSGMVTVFTSSQTADLETLTLTLSGGAIDLPTITVTAQATPTTVVLISMATVTETDQGTVTTYTQQTTLTSVIAASSPSGATSNSDTTGFIPVNAGSIVTSTPLSLLFGVWTLYCVLMY